MTKVEICDTLVSPGAARPAEGGIVTRTKSSDFQMQGTAVLPAPHVRGHGAGEWGHPRWRMDFKTWSEDERRRYLHYLASGSRELSSDYAFKSPRNLPKGQPKLGSAQLTRGRTFWQKQRLGGDLKGKGSSPTLLG